MKKIISIAIAFFILNACSKKQDGVFIRVKNSTSTNFKAVIVNSKNFNDVDASETTSYQHYETALGLPAGTAITTVNDTIVIGNTYIDWMESLTDGKYTFKIYDDTSTLSDYNCMYIKD